MPERLRVLLLCSLLLVGGAAMAETDTALDLRVTQLAQQLRCLVCQNQTIADSQAQLALDLKKQVRIQLAQGKSEQDVIDFMVQRYGDFVLYRPSVKPVTWLLWFGPFALLFGGLSALLLTLRKRSRAGDIFSEDDSLSGTAALKDGI